MIKTKKDLKKYIYSDRDAQNISSKFKRPKFIGHTYWKFTILLRKCEYHINKGHKIFAAIYKYLLLKKCYKFTTYILPNTFGPGLSIAHWGGIAISGKANIGKNCYIHQCVTIGVKGGESKAPMIGDNCTIGAGAVVLGNIKIVDNVTIGANAVVTKDILVPNSVWGGVPAKMLYIKGDSE